MCVCVCFFWGGGGGLNYTSVLVSVHKDFVAPNSNTMSRELAGVGSTNANSAVTYAMVVVCFICLRFSL